MLRLPRDESWPESWKLSQFYDELEIGNSRQNLGYSCQYKIRYQWSLRSIQELVPPGGAILDVAGGGGNFTLPLAEMGYHSTLRWPLVFASPDKACMHTLGAR